MDIETFLTHCPEFRKTSSTLVQAALDSATRRIGGPDTSVWPSYSTSGIPSLSDLAQKEFAKHLLLTSPQGRGTAIETQEGGKRTDALDEFERLCECVAGGFLVAGGDGPVPRGPRF